MKLKTLKDLMIENAKYKDKFNCNGQKLKQEAIKWAKDPNKLRKNWFKNFLEFHNITEEDLK